MTIRGDLVDAEELDFQGGFSPVVGLPDLRIFLALTILFDLKLLQIDVDLAYLYVNLEEPVYINLLMEPSALLVKFGNSKSLYMAFHSQERIETSS